MDPEAPEYDPSSIPESTPAPVMTQPKPKAVPPPVSVSLPSLLLTPDEQLIHAIYQVGIQGYFDARRAGISAECLFPEAKPVWELMEELAKLNRLPSLTEVHLKTGIQIAEIATDPIDVGLITEKIVKRELTSQLHKNLTPLYKGDTFGQDPFETRDKLLDIYQKTAWGLGNPLSINSRDAIEQFKTAYNRAASADGGLLGLSSPWPTPDSASLGLQPGELTVVFAKRKIGKSWCVIVWALHMWRHDLQPGEKILFVTMEMTELQIMRRMACVDLRLPWDDLRKGKLTMHQKKSLDDWCDQRIADEQDKTKPNIVFATSKECRTAKDIGALVAEHQPVCVVVDSFYILGRGDGKSIYEKVLGNVEALKLDVALQHNVPVLASTQLKGTVDKGTLSADSDDAMGAKAIGDYADVTRGLFADEELWAGQKRYWRGMEAREFVAKDVEINFNFETMDFSEIREILADDEKTAEAKAGKKTGVRRDKPTAEEIERQANVTNVEDDGDEGLSI